MPTNLVNLDALIPREDFEIVGDTTHFTQKDTISITDLQPGFFTNALRKPDFQRETASWSPAKIADLVTSFVNGDLIPAIILWQPLSGGSIFVIDGAHRLSALIAWVRDDYGDQEISREFFQNRIPPEQIRAADRTRKLINANVGPYLELQKATAFPTQANQDITAKVNRLASLAMIAQWVNGNADKAEASFFKINQAATPIDPTELAILHSRNNPSALSARAIVRAGTGHKYWERFAPEVQKSIETIALDIHRTLFSPPLQTPIKTLDIPVAGRAYSAQTLPLIFDLVNLVNEQSDGQDLAAKVKKRKTKEEKKKEEEVREKAKDIDGQKTVRYLNKVKQTVNRISGTNPASLGLHPAIYFYSITGRHQPPAFLAVAGFVMEMHEKGLLNEFTKHREAFEDFLLLHKDFINQIVTRIGGGLKPFHRLRELYMFVLKSLIAGQSKDDILSGLSKHHNLFFLKANPIIEEYIMTSADFSPSTKSAVFFRDALEQPRERCGICNARLHVNSIHIDHVQRKADGGMGTLDNAQLSHPYCNSTYKH
jgi:hypothetical protein